MSYNVSCCAVRKNSCQKSGTGESVANGGSYVGRFLGVGCKNWHPLK